MSSAQGNPSEAASSSNSHQESPSQPDSAIALPRASQLYRQDAGGEGGDAETGSEAQDDAATVAAAEPADRRRPFGLLPPLADSDAPTAEQRSAGSWPGLGRRWMVALAAVSVAVALTIGANTPLHDGPDRLLALQAIPSAQASSVDQPAANSDDAEASPADWSSRAAHLQFAATALAMSADAATNSTGEAAPAQVAQVNAASPAPAPAAAGEAVRGVSDKEIVFGMAAAFSGASRELGRQMKIGVEAAFDQVDDAGGVNGRRLRLAAADDGYEPTRTVGAMQQLYGKDQVFGFIGNVGTPPAAVALPFALDHHMLFFGAFTGAGLLRRDPPDRYVFNYRASYAEETDAVVRYLVKVRRIQPNQILVFAQDDSYGDSGYAGVAKAVRALPGDNPDIVRVGYKRNTVDVQNAVAQLHAFKGQIKAVVMVASYRAAAKFIEKTRDMYPALIYTNVSFVGSTALADELTLLGPRYAKGAVVTQVVPAVNSYASIILKYKAALDKYFPGEAPDYVSLEGYIDATILAEAVKRVGSQIDTEKLVDELERMRDFDMGLGTVLSFSPNDHQGSHKVWGTELDENGHYQPIDLQ
jgi:ABC-type branched-subunit amino acid transport system substrate-binding protein